MGERSESAPLENERECARPDECFDERCVERCSRPDLVTRCEHCGAEGPEGCSSCDPSEKRTGRQAIADALTEHVIDWGYMDDGSVESFCSCGARNVEIREHQADVALDALGLEQVGWRKVHTTKWGLVDDLVPMSDSPAYSPEFGYRPVYDLDPDAVGSRDGEP